MTTPIDQIARLRTDFSRVTADRTAHQGWSDADVAELGAAIKAAIEGSDAEALADLARYLAFEAGLIDAGAQACRAAEARIRAQRAAERERAS